MSKGTRSQTKQSLGGIARAQALSPERRKTIASVAAKARWEARHISGEGISAAGAKKSGAPGEVTITLKPMMDQLREQQLAKNREKQRRFRARHGNVIVQDDARRAIVRAAVARWRAKAKSQGKGGLMD